MIYCTDPKKLPEKFREPFSRLRETVESIRAEGTDTETIVVSALMAAGEGLPFGDKSVSKIIAKLVEAERLRSMN